MPREKTVPRLSECLIQVGVPEPTVRRAVGEFYPAVDKKFGEFGIVQRYWTAMQLANAMSVQEAARGNIAQAQIWLERAAQCLDADRVRTKTATAFILASKMHFSGARR